MQFKANILNNKNQFEINSFGINNFLFVVNKIFNVTKFNLDCLLMDML
ncbi:MAG: hypothetical protein HW421_1114 [Ignavibacteria bacterium]|nr:hypothetical protein [Ignavibacteria bacterium]